MTLNVQHSVLKNHRVLSHWETMNTMLLLGSQSLLFACFGYDRSYTITCMFFWVWVSAYVTEVVVAVALSLSLLLLLLVLLLWWLLLHCWCLVSVLLLVVFVSVYIYIYILLNCWTVELLSWMALWALKNITHDAWTHEAKLNLCLCSEDNMLTFPPSLLPSDPASKILPKEHWPISIWAQCPREQWAEGWKERAISQGLALVPAT